MALLPASNKGQYDRGLALPIELVGLLDGFVTRIGLDISEDVKCDAIPLEDTFYTLEYFRGGNAFIGQKEEPFDFPPRDNVS